MSALLASDKLAELAELGILDEMGRLFFSEGGAMLAALEAAMASGDLVAVRHAAHSLRGISGTIGADDLCAASKDTELAARAGREADARAGVLAVRREWDAVAPVLRTRLAAA